MEKDELHSALLYLMQKVAEIKDSQMQDKRFVTAITTVLRHFRDNGELRQAYDLHKVSVTDVEKSSWCKILMTLCNTKMEEFGTEIPPIDIKATLEKLNSDEYIDQQIKEVLGDDVVDKENKE